MDNEALQPNLLTTITTTKNLIKFIVTNSLNVSCQLFSCRKRGAFCIIAILKVKNMINWKIQLN